jgi:hypothetical protein
MAIDENICEPDAHDRTALLVPDLIQPTGDRHFPVELNFNGLQML